jgi:hypothetical protein
MSFAAITLCVASQRVFIVVISLSTQVRKLLDIPSYLVKRKSYEAPHYAVFSSLLRPGVISQITLQDSKQKAGDTASEQ